jgi:glycosyltransferase involved in cell wall biosynthesis
MERAIRDLEGPPAEVIVTTDFMNLPELLALTRDLWPHPVPAIVYFHENQITYPARSSDIRDIHFGLVNLHSALCADRVLFNSAYHRDAFLESADDLMAHMPDFRPAGVGDRIRARSDVLGVPLDLEEMNAILDPGTAGGPPPGPAGRPLVVWNHRWEEDRNPAEFFEAMERLDALARQGGAPDFGIVVAGQTYQARPEVFDRARARLADRIEHWGFIASRREYLESLSRSSVVVSTSRHEFFGLSVMEAIYMGCAPVLPRRLTYPEIACGLPACLYDDPREIPAKVSAWLSRRGPEGLEPLRDRVRIHGAPRVVARWDEIISSIAR